MKTVLLLALFSVSKCSSTTRVVGHAGDNVTLSCKYDAKQYAQLSACWSRGSLPVMGCSNKLISTDGHGVTLESRNSERYHLLGRLDEGDFSLTILHITESDAGLYGCRVEIPGLFNDAKNHFELVIMRAAETNTSTTMIGETYSETVTVSQSTALLTSTETPVTSSFNTLQSEESSVTTVVLVCVLFGFILLITAGGLAIITRKWGRLGKICQQQQVNTLAPYSLNSSIVQLQNRGLAVENIYEIEGGAVGGDYEYCP